MRGEPCVATQLVDFGTTEISTTACAQAAALIKSVYRHDVNPIGSMLLPTGAIVETSYSDQTWPPGYMIIRCDPGDWYIAIEGTTGVFSQGIWHAWGSWLAQGATGTAVNGQWQQVSGPIYDAMLAQSDGPGPVKWRIAGHSYGGAVGQLLAERLRVERPTWQVQLLTIGAPRARLEGYDGPRPQVEWRLTSYSDGVPALPYRGVYPSREQTTAPAGVISAEFVPWEHYGPEAALDVQGGINTGLSSLPAVGEGVSTAPIGAHVLANYAGRLTNRYQREGGTPQEGQALAVFQVLQSGQDAAQQSIGLPTYIVLSDGVRVVNPFYFAPISDQGVQQTMATPIVSNNIYSMLMLINQDVDDAGWDEGLFVNFGTTTPTDSQMVAAMNPILTARRLILNTKARIAAVRTRRLTPKGRSRLWEDSSQVATGFGSSVQPRCDPNVVVQIATYDPSGEVRGQINIRGVNAGAGNLTTDETRRGGLAAATIRTYMSTMLAVLVSPSSGGQPAFPRGLIEWTGNSDESEVELPIILYTLANNRLVVRVEGALVDVAVNTTVRLIHPRQRYITGLSGDVKVLAINTVGIPAGTTDYTLDIGYCGLPSDLPFAVGSVRTISRRFVELQTMSYVANSTKKCGRPFGARVARQSGCR